MFCSRWQQKYGGSRLTPCGPSRAFLTLSDPWHMKSPSSLQPGFFQNNTAVDNPAHPALTDTEKDHSGSIAGS